MRRFLPLLLAALSFCSDRDEARAPSPVALVALEASPGTRIALRAYETVMNGRRAATMRVEWREVEHEGRLLVEDITETRSRTVRMMDEVPDVFHSESISRTLRTGEGELVFQETVVHAGSRVDREKIERTPEGYAVHTSIGGNGESFEIATDRPVMVDAEAFLGARIRAGAVEPGATFPLPVLDTNRRRVVVASLRVVGPDDEGPGLKVVETIDGVDRLWWFAEDGSAVRVRAGISITRRDDSVALDDLPARPASWRITLPANIYLPRIFTTREMLVEIQVKVDETTKPPRIPGNPFTEVVEQKEDKVMALLKSHDDEEATTTLPIEPTGFEKYLEATPLMEVEDPEVRSVARSIVGDAEDAREAARRIADYVFTSLRKESPEIGQPSVKQILEEGRGDCSEHALLFTGLCRAAGIPARRCSGYACIGSDWGAHAWCEIWVGRWIGADPTTNEIGTRARYILLARPDDRDVTPGVLLAERTRIVIRRAEYADGAIDLAAGPPDVEVFSGIRLGPLPEGWSVERGPDETFIRGDSFFARVSLFPDHGYRSLAFLARRMPGSREALFGGRTAAVRRAGSSLLYWQVPLGREILVVTVRGAAAADAVDAIAELLEPTLKDVPPAR